MRQAKITKVLFLVCLLKSSSQFHEVSKPLNALSPCRYQDDPSYGGLLVDCQGQGLTSLPPPHWIPPGTTSLWLQHNSISDMDQDALKEATELRFLSLNQNNLRIIEPKALRWNTKLQVLNLEFNHINLHNVTSRWFENLHNLIELRLAYNGNQDLGLGHFYSPYLLSGLTSLKTLTLDTFAGNLDFNGIIKETKKLSTLTIAGGLSAIVNESFIDFVDVDLQQLIITGANLRTIEQGAFTFLKSLDSYSLVDVSVGLTQAFESLAPFSGRKMTSLTFHFIGGKDKDTRHHFLYDSMLTVSKARFLSQICVKHFRYTNNELFFIEPTTLTGKVWSNCLMSIDLSENPLLGEFMVLLRFKLLRMLTSFRITNRKYSLFDRDRKIPTGVSELYSPSNIYLLQVRANATRYELLHNHVSSFDQDLIFNPFPRNIFAIERASDKNNSIEIAKSKLAFGSKIERTATIFLPPNIIYLNMAGFARHGTKLETKARIEGGDNLKELYLSDSGFYRFKTTLSGIENVTIVDISKNDGSQFSHFFLNISFPHVKSLNMSRMKLNPSFLSRPNQSPFLGLHDLESLDLSENGLYSLAADLFSQNKKLIHLLLTGNRLNSITFIVDCLPNLHNLDLRHNSFLQFSRHEMRLLEGFLVKVPGFTLRLEGNVFSCGCSSIIFLRWLQTTTLSLDNQRNYSCTMENGRITTTHHIGDLEGLWRSCQGEKAFLTSLILVCLTFLAFSLFTLLVKFKTQITAVVFQYFRKNFTLKTSQDYPIGVYIGYSDTDTNLACFVLSRFVENHLGLTTYLRHRDLLPASDMAMSIVTTINSSWRIMLLVTENYLADQWSYLAMKTAMYSVGSSNPGRLVIVLLSNEDVGHQIPSYVLTAVREDSIIKLTDQNELTDAQKIALGKALLG